MNFQLRSRGEGRGKDRRPLIPMEADDDTRRARGGVNGKRIDSSLEEVFIQSLVAAGTCRRCTQSIWTNANIPGPSRRSRRRQQGIVQPQRASRAFSTTSRHEQSLAVAAPPEPEDHVTPDEYKELVNTYGDSPSDLWEPPPMPTPPLPREATETTPKREHMPLAPRLVLTAEQEDRPPHSPRTLLPPEDERHALQIRHLERLVWNSQPGEQTLRIFGRYMALPPPRLRYVSDLTVHKIFQHLAWAEHKDREASLRYFTFLDDAKSCGVKITTEEWNSAIAFAGRWARYATSEEVKKAVETWMSMEKDGESPSDVTFNILADVAARAGRFALANIVVRELHARGLPLTRYYHTNQIFYAGIRRNGEAVRQAFRALVNAGEIVDTAVMNCVMLGLVRSGEAASAENVFQRMKSLHAVKEERAIPRNWRERKKLGYELRDSALALRKEKDAHESSFFGSQYSNEAHKEAAQRKAPIHPDFRSCRILIRYHCEVSGNLERAREMLEEMKNEGCGGRTHGSAYLALFYGFGKWGGHAYTVWNRSSLEQYWKDFLSDVDEGRRPDVVPRPASQRDDSSIGEAPFYIPFDDDGLSGEITPTISSPSTTDGNSSDTDSTASSPETDLDISTLPPEPSLEDAPTHFSARLAQNAVLAFYKCAGARRALSIWAEIQRKWPGMNEWERSRVERVVEAVGRDEYVGPSE